MSNFILPVITLTYFLLGIFVLAKNIKSSTNRIFSFLVFSIALWILFLYLSDINISDTLNILTNKLVLAVGIPSSLLFLFFTENFPDSSGLNRTFRNFILWSLVIIFFAITLLTKFVVTKVEPYENGINPILGVLYYPIMIFDSLLLIGGIKNLYIKYRKCTGLAKYQLQYMIFGFVAFCLIVLPLNLIIPILTGSSETARYGPLGSIIWFIFITYSIIQHRLLDLKVIVEKVLMWLYAGILGSFIYFIITKIILSLFDNIFSFQSILITFGIIIIFAAIFIPIREYLTNKIFKKALGTDSLDQKWADFADDLSRIVEREEIANKVISFLNNSVQISNIQIAVNKKGINGDLEIFCSKDTNNKIDSKEIIRFGEIIYFPEIKFEKSFEDVKLFMEKFKFEVCLPLFDEEHKNQIGMICLGSKVNKSTYTSNDFTFLKRLRFHLENAILRSFLYDILKNFNNTLQAKVNEQTKELGDKVKQLEEASRREHDLLDIFGHELRTPMSIIKGSVGMIEMSKKQNSLTDEKLTQYIDKTKEATEREITIIENMLEATKLDSGQLEINKESIDMVDVVSDGIDGQFELAQKKGLLLEFNKPVNIKEYYAYADRTKVQEVMDNLLNNAVKYTDKGSITITIDKDSDFVTISVKDTGQGIPEDEIKNLGQKFYRLNQYLGDKDKEGLKLVRPGGTGLGLYVTFRLIKLMGGKVWVESEVGKGSIFHFSVPLFKGQQIEQPKEKEIDVFKRLGLKK